MIVTSFGDRVFEDVKMKSLEWLPIQLNGCFYERGDVVAFYERGDVTRQHDTEGRQVSVQWGQRLQ